MQNVNNYLELRSVCSTREAIFCYRYSLSQVFLIQSRCFLRAKIKMYRTIILLLVSRVFGCETWSLTFKGEKHKFVLSWQLLLRKIFGPKFEEVSRAWWKLQNGQIYDFCSLNIIRGIKLRDMTCGTTCKIIVLCVLTFVFLGSKQSTKYSGPNNSKHCSNIMCF